eukprot:2665696-Pyramimonas_sp.AAC.1
MASQCIARSTVLPAQLRSENAVRRTTSKVVAAQRKSAAVAKLSGFSAQKATQKVARDVRMNGEYGASSTSFYTTTEKQDKYDDLDTILDAKCANAQTKTVIKEMLDACADITEALRSALVTVE